MSDFKKGCRGVTKIIVGTRKMSQISFDSLLDKQKKHPNAIVVVERASLKITEEGMPPLATVAFERTQVANRAKKLLGRFKHQLNNKDW